MTVIITDVCIFRRALCLQVKSKTTTLQAAETQEKRNTLRRRIQNWRELQVIYMPGVPQLRNTNTSPAVAPASFPSARSKRKLKANPNGTNVPNLPEDECLWLPSSVPSHLWQSACASGLAEKEAKFRIAQADDALAELRRQLRICATLRDFRKTQIGGTSQKMGTRTRTMLLRFAAKTTRCAERYRAAYSAITLLDPDGEWRSRLQLLKDTDIRSPHREEDDPTEGRRELSWIWLAGRAGGRPMLATEDELNQSKWTSSLSINQLSR